MDYGKSKYRHKVIMFFLTCTLLFGMFTSFNLVYSVNAADYYGVNIECYNVSNIAQEVDFDIFFTNLSGTGTYDNTSQTSSSFYNYSTTNFPSNCHVRIKAENTSYAPRTITAYLDNSVNSSFIFYMPLFNDTYLYYIRVIDFLYDPIDDVKVNVSKYINGSFKLIASEFTDPDGRASFYLIPNDEYQVSLYKDGYHSKTETFTADPTDYGYNYPRTYSLRLSNVTQVDTTELFKNINYSLEPNGRYFNHSIDVWYNITSSDSKLTSFKLKVYRVNGSTETLLFEDTNYTTSGGSINYTITNVSGKYKVEAYFTKTGFPEVKIAEEGSRYYFIGWGGLGFSPLAGQVPKWILFTILLIIAASVMAFMYPFAGLGTGYVGLGILAFGFSMPMFEGFEMGGIGVWAILTVAALMYTIGLLLWSRL